MKTTRRILSLLLVLAMVACLSVTAFAASVTTAPSGTVTVMFTRGLSRNGDNGNIWLGNNPNASILYAGGTVDLSQLVSFTKSYIPEGTADPMNGAASVMDAIMAVNPGHNFSTGWDANPWAGNPGAYINNVNNTVLESNYIETEDEDDPNLIHCTSEGTGFVVIIKDAQGNISFPSVYVSNIVPENGMTIYVDLAAYSYTWDKTVSAK